MQLVLRGLMLYESPGVTRASPIRNIDSILPTRCRENFASLRRLIRIINQFYVTADLRLLRDERNPLDFLCSQCMLQIQ